MKNYCHGHQNIICNSSGEGEGTVCLVPKEGGEGTPKVEERREELLCPAGLTLTIRVRLCVAG